MFQMYLPIQWIPWCPPHKKSHQSPLTLTVWRNKTQCWMNMIIHLRQKFILCWVSWHQYLLEDEHCESVVARGCKCAHLNMAFSCLLKRLSHAVALARSQPWVLLNHTFQLYQLKIRKIICHMQQLINVRFSESWTMCSKSACRACCDWSAETENSRELRSPSAGPEDLIGYKYTVRPPATKMELILASYCLTVFTSKRFIQQIHLFIYARLESKQLNYWFWT